MSKIKTRKAKPAVKRTRRAKPLRQKAAATPHPEPTPPKQPLRLRRPDPLPQGERGRGDIIQIAVGALRPSPLNPRKVADDAAVAALAESIATEGVLQNLVARPSTGSGRGAAAYEIVAGERRWRAAQALVAAGRWPADAVLPVRVIACGDLELLRLAMAENMVRADLHPMDEAEALKALRDGGMETAAIAAGIGRTERHVQLRLQLADRLHPKVKAAFRASEINLAQARVLAAYTYPKRQVKALPLIVEGAYGYETAEEIKDNLGESLVATKRALFDRAAYTGEIVTDPDDGTEYFADPDEFNRLQDEAVEARRAALAEKWAWVEVERGYGFNAWNYGKSKDKAVAGAVLVVRPDGKVEVHEGLIRKKDDKKTAAKGKVGDPAPREPFTKTLLAYARNRKTAALQAAVAKDTDAAVLAAILGLVGAGDHCVAIFPVPPAADDRVLAPAVEAVLARYRGRFGIGAVDVDCGEPFGIDPFDGGDIEAFEHLADLAPAERLELFAALVAARVGSFNHNNPEAGDDDVARGLAARLGIDMAAAWRPDEAYVKASRKPRLLALVAGLSLPIEKAEKMTGKALGQAILAALPPPEAGPLAWMPPELRFATGDEVLAAAAAEEASA